MKTILVSLYRLDELSETAQEKAIERLRYMNVDFDWWEFTYDHFAKLAEHFGIAVDVSKSYFSGFYHQGQGSSYTAEVDVLKLLRCLQNETWKEEYPTQKFRFNQRTIDRRVVKLIESTVIDASADVKPANRGTSIQVTFSTDYEYNECMSYDRIEEELDKVKETVEDICEELNFYFFKSLRNEYEFLTADDQVRDSIIANGYEFTATGKLYKY